LSKPTAFPPVFCSGATGYIGGAILRHLVAEGFSPFGGVRAQEALPEGVLPWQTGDLAEPGLRLPPAQVVIHAAGLGHKRGVGAEIWRRQNVDAAVNLARAARIAGASRFILISTAHVHGRVHAGLVTDTTPPNPMDHYAAAKLQAEHDVAAAFGPGLSIIRPVAVIGPNCPGNISLLLKLLRRGVPQPFAGINNKRSFVHRDDLAAMTLAILRAERPPESLLAAHPETVSTPEMIRALAEGLGVRAKLFNCPSELLATGAAMLRRGAMWQSLAGDFCANPAAARALGWKPAQTLVESLVGISRYYNTTASKA
jgi:nucleoside-diphosphate-sugar epimerase